MRPVSRSRRGAHLALIATVLAFAAATAFDVPNAHTEAKAEPVPAAAFSGRDLGQAASALPSAPLICIDPGHSDSSPGMVVTVTTIDAAGVPHERRLREVDINLDVARDVARRLRARFGDDAVVTTWGEADGRARAWNALLGPDGDERLDLMMRGAFCGRVGARALVSLHTNWFGDAPNGLYIGYRDEDDRALAEAMHPVLLAAMAIDATGAPLREFIDYGLDPGDWFVLLGLGDHAVPAVILEPVMMSNPEEARRLLPSIADAPDGRRAQIANVEALALGNWIASALAGER